MSKERKQSAEAAVVIARYSMILLPFAVWGNRQRELGEGGAAV
jgi:hypothetical protein